MLESIMILATVMIPSTKKVAHIFIRLIGAIYTPANAKQILMNSMLIEKHAAAIEKAFIEINDNKNLFEGKTISIKGITKVFSIIRNKIKDKMHKNWKKDLMGNNLSEYGYPVFEIDESEII